MHPRRRKRFKKDLIWHSMLACSGLSQWRYELVHIGCSLGRGWDCRNEDGSLLYPFTVFSLSLSLSLSLTQARTNRPTRKGFVLMIMTVSATGIAATRIPTMLSFNWPVRRCYANKPDALPTHLTAAASMIRVKWTTATTAITQWMWMGCDTVITVSLFVVNCLAKIDSEMVHISIDN